MLNNDIGIIRLSDDVKAVLVLAEHVQCLMFIKYTSD